MITTKNIHQFIAKICSILLLFFVVSCAQKEKKVVKVKSNLTAKEILENPNYLAISYGGYRTKTRDIQPTIAKLKEDLKILSALNIKILRTYNVHLKHAENVLEAIYQLKKEDKNFEMYVMLGAWIACKNAFNSNGLTPNHNEESDRNVTEIATAVALAKKYSEIVKIIAVGNEAMVKWATSYFVQPNVILKWVNHLQNLKKTGELSKDIWITSSDNFASWGGGSAAYHTEDLTKLIHAVDFISVHTYPMHDTHYNPTFWGNLESEKNLSKTEKIDLAMLKAKDYAVSQYKSVQNYVKSVGANKTIHIGETGWASFSNGHYGNNGSKATDEYKQAVYYKFMRDWTQKEKIACFYFEAFDEQWKDAQNASGSENHFGLINLKSEAKFALWNLVDTNLFEGLTRDGKPITKTYNGNLDALLKDVQLPPIKKE
ncbi:glycosyl hydrolase family 17 [uncultured Polaribacter sp.]|uniref:glycosyl hydrolase family 17 n=1 Tax=uncultured Polaribacter sp. TaxID=174711 RepID=UPI00260405A6|nr:glycosyl hydrolase family 17 [uncultured Polaribacter sp.]